MQLSEKIIEQVQSVIDPVYLVGGSVRDILLKRVPKDYDFTTPLDPDTIEQKVRDAGRKPYLIGKKFGTVGFKVIVDRVPYYVEVTTFRRESYEENNRKPAVEFVTDLQDDLSRRDLTINAIALKDGEYFDPYGGRLDILSRKLKAVGEATDRFKEDPLRMLRVARFASQLEFDVDPNMIGKTRKMASKIVTISRERWVQELDKLLLYRADIGLSILEDTELLKFMLPELIYAVRDKRMFSSLVSELKDTDTADEAWAVLLSYTGKAIVDKERTDNQKFRDVYPQANLISNEIAHGISSRLKFSNDRVDNITGYILHHN